MHLVTALELFTQVTHEELFGWGGGASQPIEAAGINYLDNLAKGGFTSDQWHARLL